MRNENEHLEQDPVEGSRRQSGKQKDGQAHVVSSSEADNVIFNPAADGTRIVEEAANDWPSDDKS